MNSIQYSHAIYGKTIPPIPSTNVTIMNMTTAIEGPVTSIPAPKTDAI